MARVSARWWPRNCPLGLGWLIRHAPRPPAASRRVGAAGGIRWRRSSAVISGSLYRAVNRGSTSGVRWGGGPLRRTADAVVVKGPQHRLDGAVQVRGDLRGTPSPVLVTEALAAAPGPAAAGPRPPAHPDTSGWPASDAPPPRPAASGAPGLRARTHTSSTVSTVSIVATGVPWSRVAEVSGDLRRCPGGTPIHRSYLDRPPVQHDRGTAGIRPGTPRLGGVVPDRR